VIYRRLPRAINADYARHPRASICATDWLVNDSKTHSLRNSRESATPGLKDGDQGVVLQRDRLTYAVAPHIPCGMVTPELLRKIADVAERYQCQALKLTSAERIALIGLQEQDIEKVWQDLGMQPGAVTGERVRSVRVCPGTDFCKRGQQNSLAIGRVIDTAHHGQPMPGKLKIAVSGCPNQCTETATKDIGLVGTKSGWDLWVGGSGGVNPRLATRIARRCGDEEIVRLVDGVVTFYKTNAEPKERLHRLLSRRGMSQLAEFLGIQLPVPESLPAEDLAAERAAQ
jgi:NAD(P)H-nitrite reductase large subunit